MKKEKMTFAERQQKITFCRGGKMVLVLLNEKEKEEILGVMDDHTCETVTMYEYDAFWMDVNGKTYNDVIASAKREKTAEIEAYDTSSAVNGFLLNGARVWLDFELRDRVYQGNERLQRIGRTDTTLWLGKQCYNLSIEQAQNIISHIEAYAKDCYNVTAQHKAAVEKMQTLEEVLAYDYKKGYPEQLKMEV